MKILDIFVQVTKFLIDYMQLVEEPPSKEERKTAMQSPLRKVLSPINSIINPGSLKEQSCKDQFFALSYEPNTPKTPSMASATNKFQDVGTPIDKFNAWSSNIKVFYICLKLNFY